MLQKKKRLSQHVPHNVFAYCAGMQWPKYVQARVKWEDVACLRKDHTKQGEVKKRFINSAATQSQRRSHIWKRQQTKGCENFAVLFLIKSVRRIQMAKQEMFGNIHASAASMMPRVFVNYCTQFTKGIHLRLHWLRRQFAHNSHTSLSPDVQEGGTLPSLRSYD